jgi:hypothetical protein
MALTETEHWRVPQVAALIRSCTAADQPPVQLDLWPIAMAVENAEGTTEDLGVLLLCAWPRPATPPEALQALLAADGTALSREALERLPILVPAGVDALWHVGEQLKALSALRRWWLSADVYTENPVS